MKCIFCNIKKNQIQTVYGTAYSIYDKYPVSQGHMLVIPRRHFDNFFDATKEELHDILNLIQKCKQILDDKYNPDGYNIGINCGKSAGQTVMHLHIHLIPRYYGDIDNPTGGVRGVIPEKRLY